MRTEFRNWRLADETVVLPAAATVDSDTVPVLARVEAFADDPACAVEIGSEQLSYRDLVGQARAVTGWLLSRGVGPGDRVVLLTDKVISAYPALLGALGARAAFVPIDPQAPVSRCRELIRRVRPTVVVTSAELAVEVDDLVDHLLLVDEPLPFQRQRMPMVSQLPPVDVAWTAHPGDLAYVIFTSGSSGTPKGVEIERRSVDVFAQAISRLAQCGRQSRVAQSAKLSFDASLQQILSAFVTGATLVPVPDEIRVDGAAMAAWLGSRGVTHWDSVPSLWTPVVTALGAVPSGGGLPMLHTLILAGEAPRPADIDAWRAMVPQARLLNVYGPTEATVDVTSYEVVGPTGGRPVPMGAPLPGVAVHILDAAGHPCEPGIEGEIHLEGALLARGYFEDADATAKSFITVDLGDGSARRVYRTGDLGYRRPDGNLMYTGRRDAQVKINGVRIEPAEVEAALLDAPGVTEAAVAAYTLPGGTATRLVGAVVGDVDVEAVRAHINTKLTLVMRPALILTMPELPRGGSGKVDTRALRALAEQATRGEREPQNPAGPEDARHAEVLAACRKVLGHDVGVDEDLFAAGIDSISGLRLRTELGARGLAVRVNDIFTHTTVRALAQVAAAAEPSAPALPENSGGSVEVPLLASQRTLLAAALLEPERRSAGLVQEVHVYATALDPDVVARVVDEMVSRHDALRASMVSGDGTSLRQRIAAPGEVRLITRVRSAPGEVFEQMTSETAAADLAAGFDLTIAPLLKLSMITAATETALVWTMHHLVTDGWSWEILCREFTAIYAAFAAGLDHVLPAPGPSLAALARRGTETSSSGNAQAVVAELRGTVAAELAVPAVGAATATVAKETVSLTLSVDETSALRSRAQQASVTVGAVFLHVVGTALARVTGQQDLSFGVVTSGRDLSMAAISESVAPLARVVPVGRRAGAAGVHTAHEQLRRAASSAAWDVDDLLATEGLPIGVRMPKVTFVYQNYSSGLGADLAAEALRFDHRRSWSHETASSDLAVVVYPTNPDDGSSMSVRLEFWPARVEKEAARRLLREIYRELRRMASTHG